MLPAQLDDATYSESVWCQVIVGVFPSRHRLRAKHSVKIQKVGKYVHPELRDSQALLGYSDSYERQVLTAQVASGMLVW